MAPKAETDAVEHASPAVMEDVDTKALIRGADDALKFATESEGITWTDAEERRVLWKIDGVILSLVSSRTQRLVDLHRDETDLLTQPPD